MDKNKIKFKKIFFADSRIRLIWPILAVILLILIGEFLVVDPIGRLLLILDLEESTISNAQRLSEAIFEFIKRGLRSIVVVLAIWLTIRYLMKKPISFAGIALNRGWSWQILLGTFLGVVVQVVALILMALFGWYSINGFLWQFTPVEALFPSLLFAFIIGLETGVIEESVFRGFLMNSIADRFGLKVGVIISSVIFGLLHFSGIGKEFPWWLSLLSATIGGFLFAQAYLLFNNIWVPLGLHFGWHFAARILGTPGVTLEEACFLVTSVDGPVLLVVTKQGGASLFELVGMGICSLIIYLIYRRRPA
ncbi:MAG: CPBP family intramembrane metalloprotease [Candidatus Zixiibacteriota bacterium]|nr:MAG: CPBP family intramembrane metalloprotease [candidate division Zixibacteria bacterium]